MGAGGKLIPIGTEWETLIPVDGAFNDWRMD